MPERDDDLQQPAGPDEAALAIVARHALHDEELVAALAAGALDGDDNADDRARARSFVERCPACRTLHDDIAALGTSLRAEATFTTAAPRDFRLTVEDAQRLGGNVITRRAAGGIRALLLGIARPVGASVAALGMVGVLVGSAVIGAGGMGGSPAVDLGSTSGGAEIRSPAPAALGTFEIANNPVEPPKATERTASISGQSEPGRETVAQSAGAWVLAISVLAVVLGIAVFLVGVRASRDRSPGDSVS